MFQKLIAIGRNVKPIELKYSRENNTPIANFTIAVNNSYNDKAEFINCVCFKKRAEVVAKYVSKGSLVAVEGKIQTRDYMDEKTNIRRYITEIICDSVTFLDTKKDEEKPTEKVEKSSNENDDNLADLPF